MHTSQLIGLRGNPREFKTCPLQPLYPNLHKRPLCLPSCPGQKPRGPCGSSLFLSFSRGWQTTACGPNNVFSEHSQSLRLRAVCSKGRAVVTDSTLADLYSVLNRQVPLPLVPRLPLPSVPSATLQAAYSLLQPLQWPCRVSRAQPLL